MPAVQQTPLLPQGPSTAACAGWERVSAAAEVLRGELQRPGGFHRARARGIVERLTGVTLGAARETALDVWGAVYGVASGILHGGAAGPSEAVQLYIDSPRPWTTRRRPTASSSCQKFSGLGGAHSTRGVSARGCAKGCASPIPRPPGAAGQPPWSGASTFADIPSTWPYFSMTK